MGEKKRPKARLKIMSFAVPLATRAQLDYLAELYEAYRPQVPGLRFRRVSRSVLLRMALAHLYADAVSGRVGPELLLLAGQDRRAGRRVGPRRRPGAKDGQGAGA